MPFRTAVVLFLALPLCPVAAQAPQVGGPGHAMESAEQLVDLYNWYDAQPLFAEAERMFLAQGDERNALFARASRLRGEMQVRPFHEVIEAIDEIRFCPQTQRGTMRVYVFAA